MPKKHRQSYLSNKPNYVHPTLSGGKRGTATEQATPSTLSVNERLSQLRLAQSSPAATNLQREIAELSGQRSLPPSVGQGILGFTPTAAPQARPGLRSRIRLRTPGPAPPPSWQSRTTPARRTDESRYRPAEPSPRTFGRKATVERNRPEHLARFLELTGDNPIDRGSLLGTALRTTAENWDAIVEDCLDDLGYLPLHIRAVLLSYLAEYGPANGVDIRSLQALLPGEADVKCLDLSGLAGWDFSLKELKRFLAAPVRSFEDAEAESSATFLESWEEEVEDGTYAPLSPILATRAPFLTKLSLSHPPSSVSWKDLLSLSRDIGTLSHLSLAYWPTPTRTPNMKTASYTSRTGAEQAAGATSLYSAIDNDYQESTIILRQLSENLYCLRWLDLEGCSNWLPALVWQGHPLESDAAATGWETGRRTQGPDWRGSWRNVAYLRLSQDWTPGNGRFMGSAAFKGRVAQRYFHLGNTHLQIIQSLGESVLGALETSTCEVCRNKRNGGGDFKCDVCTAYYDVETARLVRWLEREADAWAVGRTINQVRAGSGSSRCTFDHGWQTLESYSVYTRT